MSRRRVVWLCAIGIVGVVAAWTIAVDRSPHTPQVANLRPSGPSALEESGAKSSPPPAVRPQVKRQPVQPVKRSPAQHRPVARSGERTASPQHTDPSKAKAAIHIQPPSPDVEEQPAATHPKWESETQTPAPAPPERNTEGSTSPQLREPVLTPPVLLMNPPPADDPSAYHVVLERGALAPQLRTLALEGRVVLRVLVLADGTVARADVERSSGQTPLDQAAVTAARSWRFDPATRDGAPIDAWVLIPVRFVLR